MRSVLALALLFSLAPAACGDEGVAPFDGPPPPPVAAENFASAYTDAFCSRQERCFNLAPYIVDQCRADTMAFYADDVVKGVAAGRLLYDDAAAGKCVARIEKAECLIDRFDDETLAACYGALQGTLKPGEACDAPFECVAGICGGESTTTCPASCPVVLEEGQPCSLLSGPSCDERHGIRCSGGVCVRPAGEGTPCIDRNGCESGLVCGLGACSKLRGLKEGCAGTSSCEAGLYCVAEGDEGGLCNYRLAEGAKCGSTDEDNNAGINGSQCADGLVCKGVGLKNDGSPVGGVCSKPSPLGGECLPEPDGMQVHLSGCLAGLDCAAGKCEVPPTSGACLPHAVCKQGVAYCDLATTTCMTLKTAGDACSIGPECDSGRCEGDVCISSGIYCHEG